MVEYSKDNRFPFHSSSDDSIAICMDSHEDMYEFDLIYGKIIERYPMLDAEPFYAKIHEIDKVKQDAKRMTMLKNACDCLLKDIRTFLSDEGFIHGMHDRYGLGIDKII